MAEATKTVASENTSQTSEDVKEPTQVNILKDLTNLTHDIVDTVTYLKEVGQRIDSDIENIKYNIDTGSSLRIGRESVQPLIEIKNTATEVFTNVRECEVEMLHQETDLEPLEKNLDELKMLLSETQQYTNYLSLTSEAIVKVGEQQRNQKANANGNESSSSVSSFPGNCPSVSGFSIFDSSSTNVATSSPILQSSQNREKQQE